MTISEYEHYGVDEPYIPWHACGDSHMESLRLRSALGRMAGQIEGRLMVASESEPNDYWCGVQKGLRGLLEICNEALGPDSQEGESDRSG